MAKTNPPSPSPANVFKAARQAKGLSIETVHEITKIPMDVLKAIEEGYTVRSVSPFYLKGFKKMYAKHLGIDCPETVSPDAPRRILPKPVGRIAVKSEFSERAEKFMTRQRQQQLIKVVGALIVVFVLVRIGGCIVHSRQTTKSETRKTAVVKAENLRPEKTKVKETARSARKSVQPVVAVIDPPSEEEAPVPAVKTAPVRVEKAQKADKVVVPSGPAAVEGDNKSAPVFSKPVNLTVKANKSGWLQVKVDGVLVFQSTMKEGSSDTWQADEMIELSGKNIHSLEFEVNGKLIGGLGREDRSARKVVVTKNGLSVKM